MSLNWMWIKVKDLDTLRGALPHWESLSSWTAAGWGDDIPGVGGWAQVPAEKRSAEKRALPKVKKLVYVYLVRYAEEQQDLALLSISTFQRGLKVRGLSLPPRAWASLALYRRSRPGERP